MHEVIRIEVAKVSYLFLTTIRLEFGLKVLIQKFGGFLFDIMGAFRLI